MAKVVKTQTGKQIEIEESNLKSGGQGGIRKILTPGYEKDIAKIYHDPSKAAEIEPKILSMIKFSPFNSATAAVKRSLAWPVAALYEKKVFVGYVMPRVEDSIELTELMTPKSPHLIHGHKWKKFDISNPSSMETRLGVCYNISRAVQLLHKNGMYTLVDMKPDNIMINDKGFITLIDLDSIQITDKNDKILFYADVATEDYAPPEFSAKKVIPRSSKIDNSWDIFSLAVMCYKILFAIHPYQASHQQFSTISELIAKGYFVHGHKKNELYKIPYPHKRFDRLPKNLKVLFFRTFEKGHSHPENRPEISEWVDVLKINLRSKIFSPPEIHLTSQINEDSVEIKWETVNTLLCQFDGKNVQLKGSSRLPLANKTYVFTVVGKNGTTISRKLKIQIPRPKILNFSIENISNGFGELHWDVSHAKAVYLNGSNVTQKGKAYVNLYLPNYTLSAENKIYQSVKKEIKNPVWGLKRKFIIKSGSQAIVTSKQLTKSKSQILFSDDIQKINFDIRSLA